jgi:hypothetical protein
VYESVVIELEEGSGSGYYISIRTWEGSDNGEGEKKAEVYGDGVEKSGELSEMLGNAMLIRMCVDVNVGVRVTFHT